MRDEKRMTQCMGCMEIYEAYDDICPYCGYVNGTPPTELYHLEPGSVLAGKYLLGKVLGYGGFGITYIAWDQVLSRKVAIKEYMPREFGTRAAGTERVSVYSGDKGRQFTKGLRSFLEEARVLMKFHSLPGIVQIFDRFEENNTAYIVMEYLDGETLKSKLARDKEPMSMDQVQEYMLPIMEALQMVHKENLIHRDISPDNIFLTWTGEVKLLDFGSARHVALSEESNLSVIVKPGYAPPEQYQINGNQGPWTDVYALAAVIYQMLTGLVPENSMERMGEDSLLPPSRLKIKIDKFQENALLNALNLSIVSRTKDMETFKCQLFDEEPVSRIVDGETRPKRSKFPFVLAGAAMLALLAGGAFYIKMQPGPVSPGDDSGPTADYVDVDSYYGQFFEEEEKKAAEKHITLKIVDRENDVEGSEGKIINQNPAAGSKLPSGGTVEVIVSAGDKQQTMKSYYGYSREKAEKDVTARDKLILNFENEVESSLIPGYVVTQEPKKGEKIPEGSAISLSLSAGRDYSGLTPGKMPALLGKTFEEALQIAEKEGFYIGIEKQDYFADETVAKKGQICQQSLKENEQLGPEEKILVVISKGPEMMEIPDLHGKSYGEASEMLEKARLVPARHEEYSDSVEEGFVISQSIDPGEKVKEGSTVELTVSMGKKPAPKSSSSSGSGSSKSNKSNKSSGSKKKKKSGSKKKSGGSSYNSMEYVN
ncbi:MAG: PASTA domain-containing protein [Eubacterium sp.]|nr:PASTA domain-containing protein [Eubacterium sp.]